MLVGFWFGSVLYLIWVSVCVRFAGGYFVLGVCFRVCYCCVLVSGLFIGLVFGFVFLIDGELVC